MAAEHKRLFAHLVAAGLVSSGLAGCSTEKAPRPTPPPASPASVSGEAFATLKWLSGRWRGAEAGGAPFYESYEQRSSGLIATYSFGDSTFGAPSDSGRLELRGDTLFSGSPTIQWVAIRFDSAQVEFAPWRGASNNFAWRRGADRTWTATIQWDSAGVQLQRVYEMRPVQIESPSHRQR